MADPVDGVPLPGAVRAGRQARAANLAEAAASPDPASPVDYLDKIFQIPYVLAPSPPAAVASYLQSLLPAPAAPPTAAPEAASSGHSGTEAASDGTAAAAADPQIDGAGQAPAAVASEPGGSPRTQPAGARQGQGPNVTIASPEPRTRSALVSDSQETAAAAATPDLRPRGLQVSQPEVEFLGRLGPVLPTPRAAKRLVNLYRLVRISIPEADLAAFAGTGDGQSEYQFVQILLAILVASPAMAQRILQEIMAAPADSDIRTVLGKIAAARHGEGGGLSG